MRRAILFPFMLCLTTIAGSSCAEKAQARDYWIDYANGRDGDDGSSKLSAWKHAPGDPNATGAAASAKIGPGDRLIFVSGARYRGSISIVAQGTAAQPVIIMGEGEDQSAIIDGSDVLGTSAPCASQAECGGSADWQKLSLLSFPEALPKGAALFGRSGPLVDAQWPDPVDPFYSDNIREMAAITPAELQAGAAPVPSALAAALKAPGDIKVALWVRSNRVSEVPSQVVGEDVVRFEARTLNTYSDRDGRFSLRGHPALISRPGEYALLPGRRFAIAWLEEPGANVSVGTGRGGFDLAGSSFVEVRGLSFENMSDIPGLVRRGIPIAVQRAPASDLLLANNRFANLFLVNGQGAITLQKVNGAVVRDNVINNIMFGSGMRVSGSRSVRVVGNRITRIGRTGIMLMSNEDVTVERNFIRDIRGVHGNGISAYLGNRNLKILANSVVDAYQPATFHGNREKSPEARKILIANNLFVATPDALGALISWGANTNDVTIVRNVLLGGDKGALRLSPKDNGLVVTGNVIAGIVFGGAPPPDWRVANNGFSKLGTFQSRHKPADRIDRKLQASTAATAVEKLDLASLCPYLQTEDAAAPGSDLSRSIGAEFQCP